MLFSRVLAGPQDRKEERRYKGTLGHTRQRGRSIGQGVDGFAFEGIDGASVLFGMFESGIAESRGNGFDVGSVVEQID